jgi:hypothetical protein
MLASYLWRPAGRAQRPRAACISARAPHAAWVQGGPGAQAAAGGRSVSMPATASLFGAQCSRQLDALYLSPNVAGRGRAHSLTLLSHVASHSRLLRNGFVCGQLPAGGAVRRRAVLALLPPGAPVARLLPHPYGVMGSMEGGERRSRCECVWGWGWGRVGGASSCKAPPKHSSFLLDASL